MFGQNEQRTRQASADSVAEDVPLAIAWSEAVEMADAASTITSTAAAVGDAVGIAQGELQGSLRNSALREKLAVEEREKHDQKIYIKMLPKGSEKPRAYGNPTRRQWVIG